MSKLAVFSCVAPFLAVILAFAGMVVASNFAGPKPTPAVSEELELLGALPPFIIAGLVSFIALLRVAMRSEQVRGIVCAAVGLALSVIMFIGMFVMIVSSHAWLD